MSLNVSRKIIRQEADLIVVREALGQMIEYDVYRVLEDGSHEYLGGGSKRETLALFRRLVRESQ